MCKIAVRRKEPKEKNCRICRKTLTKFYSNINCFFEREKFHTQFFEVNGKYWRVQGVETRCRISRVDWNCTFGWSLVKKSLVTKEFHFSEYFFVLKRLGTLEKNISISPLSLGVKKRIVSHDEIVNHWLFFTPVYARCILMLTQHDVYIKKIDTQLTSSFFVCRLHDREK